MKKQKLLTIVAALAAVVASTIATSACFFFGYQPEEPECLQDK